MHFVHSFWTVLQENNLRTILFLVLFSAYCLPKFSGGTQIFKSVFPMTVSFKTCGAELSAEQLLFCQIFDSVPTIQLLLVASPVHSSIVHVT